MRKDEANSACVSRKGKGGEKVISWVELKGFGTRRVRWWRRKGWVKGDLNSGGWKMTLWFITDVGSLGAGLCWGRRGLRRGELVSQRCLNTTDWVA